jgi:hypothetical protein
MDCVTTARLKAHSRNSSAIAKAGSIEVLTRTDIDHHADSAMSETQRVAIGSITLDNDAPPGAQPRHARLQPF